MWAIAARLQDGTTWRCSDVASELSHLDRPRTESGAGNLGIVPSLGLASAGSRRTRPGAGGWQRIRAWLRTEWPTDLPSVDGTRFTLSTARNGRAEQERGELESG